MHYLDNAATTRVAPEVAAIVEKTLEESWANPSALYAAGAKAEAVIESARGTVAKTMGVPPKEVVFTASGTEGNNIALLGAAKVRANWGCELVATGYEHPSVSGPLEMLAKREGFSLKRIEPSKDGRVDLNRLVGAVGTKTALVAAMHVNNESGAMLDVATLAAAVKAKNTRCFVHVDGVQGFCKVPLNLSSTKIDSYAVSGHKIHAPKGVGALWLRASGNFVSPISGGGQENGLRPGTENTPYIAGFAKAVELAAASSRQHTEHMAMLRARLLAGLAEISGVCVLSPDDAYPGIVIFSMPEGYRSEVMIHHLDAGYGVMVSSGSACHGGRPSHTLTAMGVPPQQIDAALRVSFSSENTEADVDALLEGLLNGLQTLAHGRLRGR